MNLSPQGGPIGSWDPVSWNSRFRSISSGRVTPEAQRSPQTHSSPHPPAYGPAPATDMSNLTFQAIEPLVASKEVLRSSVSVTFRCPETDTEVPSTGTLKRMDSVKSTAARSVKKNLWSSLRRSVTKAVSDALGSGAAGRIARDVTNTTMRQGEQKTAFSKEEVQNGIVEAFKAVQASFKWNASNETWVGVKKPANKFEERLAESPVTERYDQGVLARTLIELSAADGEISADEIAFISDFIDPELGSVDELSKRDPLTAAELSETSEGARQSILMLAWACAMCDEELADAEVARLGEISNALGFDDATQTGLRQDAQKFLFEQALAGVYAGGSRDDEAFTAAQEAAGKMGIQTEEVQRMDAGYRRAAGIV